MVIGQKIKKLRELKNLTQEHMASQLGLTQSTYSKLETGEIDVPYSRLEDISKILGLKPEDIIAFNEHMVFNVMHNETGNGLVIHQISPNEQKLYEGQISTLKEEIKHLTLILDKVLGDK